MPFNPNQWVNTSGKFGHGRSADLLRVDQALHQYLLGKSGQRLKALAGAILDWQATKVPWTASIRAAAVMELINYVKAEAGTRFPDGHGEIFSYVKCERVVHQLHSDPRQLMRHRPIYVSGEPNGAARERLGSVRPDVLTAEPARRRRTPGWWSNARARSLRRGQTARGRGRRARRVRAPGRPLESCP